MSTCRCAPSSRASRISARSRPAASRLPTSGASGRSSGVSADTFTLRLTRGIAPTESLLELPAAPASRRSLVERAQRVGAALRVAVRLLDRDRRLAEQVERGRDAVLPELAQHPQRVARRLADDEAMGHVTDAGGGRQPERPRSRLRVRHSHRRVERRRALVHLAQERAQVTGEILQRAAGRHDVDEPKQRRAKLGVSRGELHRLLVQRLDRMASRRRERVRELATDALDLPLERRGHDKTIRAGRGLLEIGAEPVLPHLMAIYALVYGI